MENQTVPTDIKFHALKYVIRFQILMMENLCTQVLVDKLNSSTSPTH